MRNQAKRQRKFCHVIADLFMCISLGQIFTTNMYLSLSLHLTQLTPSVSAKHASARCLTPIPLFLYADGPYVRSPDGTVSPTNQATAASNRTNWREFGLSVHKVIYAKQRNLVPIITCKAKKDCVFVKCSSSWELFRLRSQMMGKFGDMTLPSNVSSVFPQ